MIFIVRKGDIEMELLDENMLAAFQQSGWKVVEPETKSEVVADGNLYTSRYVRRLSGYEWPTYNYTFCSTCNPLTRKNSFQDMIIMGKN